MSARLGPARAWRIVLALVALLSFAAAVPLTVLSGQLGDAVIAAVIGVPCAAVGWAVARRHPGNPIGWLFLAISVFMFLGTAGGDYGYLAYKRGHHLPLAPAGLALAAFWGLSLTLFGVAVLLFPDGTLPSRFWRGALRLYCALFAAAFLATCAAIAGALSAHPVRVDSTAAPPLSCLRRAGAAGAGGAPVFLARGGGRVHPGRGGAVQPGPAAGAACGGPAVQPGPLRRRPDRDGVRRPAAGRGGPRCRPRRPGRGGPRRARAGPRAVWLRP